VTGAYASQSFDWGGAEPVSLTNPGSQTATVGTPLTVQIHAVDAAGVPLVYSATGLPAGLSISTASGLISGTPTTSGLSPAVTVTATDENGASQSVSFSWQVNSGGQAPAITSANSATFAQGVPGSFTVTTTGKPTGSLMVISESGKLPSGVTFTSDHNGTATVAGTAKTGTKGAYPITITASNGVSPVASQSFTLYVKYPTVVAVINAPSPAKVGTAFLAVALLSTGDSGGTVSFSVSYNGGAPAAISSCQNRPVVILASACFYTPANPGTYTVTASFSGDANFVPATGSNSVNALEPTNVSLSFPASPPKGKSLNVTAKVSPTPNAGTVSFSVVGPNGKVPCPGTTLSGGVTGCSFTPTQDGTYTVSASYSGSALYASSFSTSTVRVSG
jgi:hypothetical protein